MSSSDTASATDRPALGNRENWWGDNLADEADDPDADQQRGHAEVQTTDPADYIAFQCASRFVSLQCGTTERPLSEPSFYLPRQTEVADGHYVEYTQHRHRRRVEPESGRINWGETTSSDLPEYGREVFERCVATYLLERGYLLTKEPEYIEYANRVWHDPQYDSHGALAQFIKHVRGDDD